MVRGIHCIPIWLAMSCVLVAAQQAPPAPQSALRRVSGPEGHTLVVIPGGEFTMGSPPSERGHAREETPHRVRILVRRVSNDVARTRRGGSFAYEWFTVRSAHRGDVTYFPNQIRDNVGFRVARTMP